MSEHNAKAAWCHWKNSGSQEHSKLEEIIREHLGSSQLEKVTIGPAVGIDAFVHVGVERSYAFPLQSPEDLDYTGFTAWMSIDGDSPWILPGFLTGPQVIEWKIAAKSPPAERTDRLIQVLERTFTDHMIARLICTFANSHFARQYTQRLVEASECYWLGQYNASAGIIFPLIEGVITRICTELLPSNVTGDSTIIARANKAFDHAAAIACTGSIWRHHNGTHQELWVPPEFLRLEARARVHYIALIFMVTKRFLTKHYFQNTLNIDTTDSMVLNRHILAHGLTEDNATKHGVLRLLGLMSAILQWVSFLRNGESINLYGLGGTEWGVTIEEPLDPIDALNRLARGLRLLQHLRKPALQHLRRELDSLERRRVEFARKMAEAGAPVD